MRGLRKIIGGFLGFLFAGPGGCLLGILIGHAFDKHLTVPMQTDPWSDIWRKITTQFRYNQENQNNDHFFSDSELVQAYHTLDLTENATQLEVKRAYRRLIHRYHPDRLVAKELSVDELREVTQKAQQIKDSYEMICKKQKF